MAKSYTPGWAEEPPTEEELGNPAAVTVPKAATAPAPAATAPTSTVNPLAGGLLGNAMPKASTATAGGYVAGPTYDGSKNHYEASADETVLGQLDRLLNKNGSYVQQARAKALSQANSRGLGNSSLAAGWGKRAAIESALPIAQQDAGFGQDLRKVEQTGIINSQLNKQQEMGQAGLAYVQGEQARTLQTQSDAAAMARQVAKQVADEQSQSLQMSADVQKQLQSTLGPMSQQYQAGLTSILTSTAFADDASRQAAIQDLTNRYRADVNMQVAFAGMEPFVWESQAGVNGESSAPINTVPAGSSAPTALNPFKTVILSRLRQMFPTLNITKIPAGPNDLGWAEYNQMLSGQQ